MRKSHTLTISNDLTLYFYHAHDTFEIIVAIYTPKLSPTPTIFYTKIWEVGLKEAGLIVELISNSLEELLPTKHLFASDYNVFSIRKISDTVFRLHISPSVDASFWAHLTPEQVNDLLTIMQQIHDTLAKGQE